MSHQPDLEALEKQHNIARFCVENRQLTMVLLFIVLFAGVFGYKTMPKRKDPDVPVRVALAACTWPGATPFEIDEQVAQQIEKRIALNSWVENIDTTITTGFCSILIELKDDAPESGPIWDDINLKLNSLATLPPGAGPIQFNKDFGTTAALMLTVASPKESLLQVRLRAQAVAAAIRKVRSQKAVGATANGQRVAIVAGVPGTINTASQRGQLEAVRSYLGIHANGRDVRILTGDGFIGLDGVFNLDDAALLALLDRYAAERLQVSEFHPDATEPVIIRDPDEAEAKLLTVRGDKYTYRQLDDYTDLMQRRLQQEWRLVGRVTRTGVQQQQIYLVYSQPRLAAYGLQATDLKALLQARNITTGGAALEASGRTLQVAATGQFTSEKEIGDVVIDLGPAPVALAPGTPRPIRTGASPYRSPVYLRDLVDIQRGYIAPPDFLNDFTYRDSEGQWQTSRAITLAIDMTAGQQIANFGKTADAVLDELKGQIPADLITARTSDQPVQVVENIDLFMNSLYEAIILVILTALIGFWEWRSALLMGLCIPITMAATFAAMRALGLDVQQISIASLILALGLLVDVPVVAGDAIKHRLDAGIPKRIAAWAGPMGLWRAMLFATITNVAAYAPFQTLPGDTGKFLYSLPLVLASSLFAALILSVTFLPVLSYYILRPSKKPAPPIEELRKRGFYGFYFRIGTAAIRFRWIVLAVFVVLIAGGLYTSRGLKTAFFPKDLSYLSYVDIWLPEDAALATTRDGAYRAADVIRDVCEEHGRKHPGPDGKPRQVLQSLTMFIGGGGPRFWFSLAPESPKLNYAQIVVNVVDKHDTNEIVNPLQEALLSRVSGAVCDVRQLETGSAVGLPVARRLMGSDIATLRRLTEELKKIYLSTPLAWSVRDDWGANTFAVKLAVDTDRANVVGISNADVSSSATGGIQGETVTTLREGIHQIPIVTRLQVDERARISDIENLYVFSGNTDQSVPLKSISSIDYQMQTGRIVRRNQYRAIKVSALPAPGHLASEVIAAIQPKLDAFEKGLPPGYRMEVSGEQEKQEDGFGDLMVVLAISVVSIYLALLFQFRDAVKPLIVFAAVPFGFVAGLVSLVLADEPFGFMAFLGLISLIGIIVSHIIVLFDFIEEMHAEGEPLEEALLDAGIMRIRPVLITVAATVLGLIPLAMHGGPLWEGLCFAQIGGLSFATIITLGLVPVLYAICVKDLKIVKWGHVETEVTPPAPPPAPEPGSELPVPGKTEATTPASETGDLPVSGKTEATPAPAPPHVPEPPSESPRS